MPPILSNTQVKEAEMPPILPYLLQQGEGTPSLQLPQTIPGLLMWLRSDQGVFQSGGTVYQWNDLSGNGNNVSQATVGKQPTFIAGDPHLNNLRARDQTW